MLNDLRFALRTLRRAPAFALVAILSLALGIGANTAIFSLLYQAVLRSLPVRSPEALVALKTDDYSVGSTRRDNNFSVFSYPMYQSLRDRAGVFSGLIARGAFPATLVRHGEALRTSAEVVTGNFFDVLGVRPALGRLLTPADDSLNREPVIVLSYSWWVTHFTANPRVLDEPLLMNGHAVTVVGVAPTAFYSLVSGQAPDFYLPLAMTNLVSTASLVTSRPDSYWLNVIGRLRPGVSRAQADAALQPLFRSVIRDELPLFQGVDANSRRKLLAKTLNVDPAAQGLNSLGTQWETPLLVLMVMVGLVLLIACANVASLLIARASARQREIAVRLALGANTWQVARQLMVESLVLALIGGLFGVFLSGIFAGGLLHMLPADAAGGWLEAHIDAPVLGFSTAISLLTGLLFGVAPALQGRKSEVAPSLKAQSTGATAPGSQARGRQMLVIAQVALAMLLLVGAGLFTRTLLNLVNVDPGFQADHLIVFSIDPGLSGYDAHRSEALFQAIDQKLRSLPGTQSAAIAVLPPFGGFGWGTGVRLPGAVSPDYMPCGENAVSPGYFRTLGIPLWAGRTFTAQDTASSMKVAIISRSFARTLFGKTDPIGRVVHAGDIDADLRIVGIVRDFRNLDLRETPGPFLFVPFDQAANPLGSQAAFFVRTGREPRGMMAEVRTAVGKLDPEVPLDQLTLMKTMVDDSIYRNRLTATLGVAFGALATLLAAVGLYGTISWSVARRTREFGIRLVLGADPPSVLLFVLQEVGMLIAIGVGIAVPAMWLLVQFVQSQLYGIQAHDPLVLLGAAVLITLVAFVAGLTPALRAMRIEPVRALRYE